MSSLGKAVVGVVGGAVTACVGVIISVNPVTTKVMQVVGQGSGPLAGEIVLKVAGLICIAGLSYLVGKNLSKDYLRGFVVGVVALAILDLAFFIIASM